MPEPPIKTIGRIRESLGGPVFRAELPNGKQVFAHLPRRLADLAEQLQPGDSVHLEMTPFDFDKARIAGIADPHE